VKLYLEVLEEGYFPGTNLKEKKGRTKESSNNYSKRVLSPMEVLYKNDMTDRVERSGREIEKRFRKKGRYILARASGGEIKAWRFVLRNLNSEEKRFSEK